MNKYLIIVKADTNDGDYITSKSYIDYNKIDQMKNICNVIKKDSAWGSGDLLDDDNDPKRFINSGKLTKEDINFFNKFVPCGEYGIHTIESVDIYEINYEESLL